MFVTCLDEVDRKFQALFLIDLKIKNRVNYLQTKANIITLITFKIIVSYLICLVVIKIHRRENNLSFKLYFLLFIITKCFLPILSLDRFLSSSFLRQPCKYSSPMISRDIQTSFIVSCRIARKIYSTLFVEINGTFPYSLRFF